jgi:hypothetical protein
MGTQEHSELFGRVVRTAEGRRLGRVIRVEGDRLIVERGLVFRTDLAIALDEVGVSSSDELRLRGPLEAYLGGARAVELTAEEDDLPSAVPARGGDEDEDERLERSDGTHVGQRPLS